MINLEELKKRSDYIIYKNHPTEELIIWNYNIKCQFDGTWDKYTLMCRGLITDIKGNVVARPFPKFFNFNEREETFLNNLPQQSYIVTEKLDGSLGIQYYASNDVHIATRGSFESEQALWATKWIQERFNKDIFKTGFTYLYEIIYPGNRIVVDYGHKSELVLLAVIDNCTGEELDCTKEAQRIGLNSVKCYSGLEINDIVNLLPKLDKNKEGFVVKYKNGLRVKFKGDEYKKFHAIISHLSTTTIYELLKSGNKVEEIIKNIPDEFHNWVAKIVFELCVEYTNLELKAIEAYDKVKLINTRKEQALYILENYKNISSLIFLLLDDKPIDDTIWKMIKPKHKPPNF